MYLLTNLNDSDQQEMKKKKSLIFEKCIKKLDGLKFTLQK